MPDTFEIEVGETVVNYQHPEDGPSTRRQYFVHARKVGSDRYWSDYYHYFSFAWQDGAQKFRDKIAASWGENPTEDRFLNNPNWTRNTAPNPLQDLEPYGYEWMREQEERHYGR